MEKHRLEQISAGGKNYVEFLRRRDLSVGVYRLPAGAADPQQPHGEDEVYFVHRGRARFQSGSDDMEVRPGDVILVAAGEPHHFYQITDDLELLVFFAPAEGSRRPFSPAGAGV